MILDWLMPWRKTNHAIEQEIEIREEKVAEHTATQEFLRDQNGFALMFTDAGLGTVETPTKHHRKQRRGKA